MWCGLANAFIFDRDHSLGKRATSRADSWALRLQAYDMKIKTVPGNENIADALSRLISKSDEALPFEGDDDQHFLYAVDAGSMTIDWNDIERCSAEDEELQAVRAAIHGKKWPTELFRYEAQQAVLYSRGNCVFKDNKIILPKELRTKSLQSAHEGHVGESAMKKIMRDYFWWPGMAKEVEEFVKHCGTCAVLSKRNPPLPLSSRELPSGPWQILQIDFLALPGFGSGEFLSVVDTYSRYLTVTEVKRIDAEYVNAALCDVFKQWGLPLILQSDNGPPFQSVAFTQFWENKGVKVRKAIPLSPQSNGMVERNNQGITKSVSAAKIDGSNWRHAMNNYVHKHNTLIPHSRLNVTPFELLVGWKFRGLFPSLGSRQENDLDRTDVQERDAEAKLKSKKYADSSRGAKESNINCGDEVLVWQNKKHKTDPTFSSERYRVIAREGAKVVIMSSTGVHYTRNIQDVRRAPENWREVGVSTEEIELTADKGGAEGFAELAGEATVTEAESSAIADGKEPNQVAGRELRRRETIRKPTKYDDRFVYNVYQ